MRNEQITFQAEANPGQVFEPRGPGEGRQGAAEVIGPVKIYWVSSTANLVAGETTPVHDGTKRKGLAHTQVQVGIVL